MTEAITTQPSEVMTVKADEVLDKIRSGERVAYKDCIIVGEVNLFNLGNGLTIKGELVFENVTFNEEMSIHESFEFLGEVTFKQCKFLRGCNFSGAKFNKEISFYDSKFVAFDDHLSTESYIFRQCKFLRGCNFGKVKSHTKVRFDHCEFEAEVGKGSCDLQNAEFHADTHFAFCIFKGEGVRFDQTQFNTVRFGSCDFVGIKSQKSTFSSSATFENCMFRETSFFNDCMFKDDVSFQFSTFAAGGVTEFCDSDFKKGISFYGTNIQAPVIFTGSKLGQFNTNEPCPTEAQEPVIPLNLKEAIVHGPIGLIGTRIEGQLNCERFFLDSRLEVDWSTIEKPLDDWISTFLTDKENPNLVIVQRSEEEKVETKWAIVEDSYLKLSENFKKAGRIRESRQAWYAWVKLNRERKSRWEKLIDKLLDAPSSRGTEPWRPVWIGLIFVLSFTLVIAGINLISVYKKAPPPARPLQSGVSETLNTDTLSDSKPADIKLLSVYKNPLPPAVSKNVLVQIYYSLLSSLETFLPVGKPKLIGDWEVKDKYKWLFQLVSFIGWLWAGLTALSVRESFFVTGHSRKKRRFR
ncbi:pentapeptide repeat-containing protein [Candidatus Poribacteria bacterium]|nr:pentapeptide repeat-containing protein [Candidatus Poribacteria bacterium]